MAGEDFKNKLQDMLSEEDRAKLMGALQPQKNSFQPIQDAMEESLLKEKEAAAATPLGSLFGMGLTPEEEQRKRSFKALRSPEQQAKAESMQAALSAGMDMGMGVGSTGVNKLTPQMLRELKGAQFTGAAKDMVSSTVGKQAAQMADNVPNSEIAKMLAQRDAERKASAIGRLEAEYGSKTGQEAVEVGKRITDFKNKLFDKRK